DDNGAVGHRKAGDQGERPGVKGGAAAGRLPSVVGASSAYDGDEEGLGGRGRGSRAGRCRGRGRGRGAATGPRGRRGELPVRAQAAGPLRRRDPAPRGGGGG